MNAPINTPKYFPPGFFKTFIESCPDLRAQEELRTDAANAPSMGRELEHVFATNVEIQYPGLPMADGQVLPIDSSVPASKKFFIYYVYDGGGIARFLDSYAQSDMPTVGVSAKEVIGKTQDGGSAYTLNWREILESSNMPGLNLESRKAQLTRRAQAQLHSDTGWYGSTKHNFHGLLTHPNITVTPAPLNAGLTSTSWRNKTFEEIMSDFDLLINTPELLTNKIHKVNTVMIPHSLFLFLKTIVVNSANSSNITILKLLQEIYPGVEFMGMLELQANKSDGRLATDVAIAFERSTMTGSLVIPEVYLQMAPHWDGLEAKVATVSVFGGTKIEMPLAFNLMPGVSGVPA